ncbi:MAG: hypothetical protein CMH54_08805 [Myxococcales bacterium]|nr:hypothetical protein [Myxococcales bacterium]
MQHICESKTAERAPFSSASSRSTLLLFLFAVLWFSPLKVVNAQTSVIVNGTGTNAREAKNDAYRNAVEQAVGTMIEANTRIENDDLVEDSILTHSAGYIQDFKILKQVKRGGLVRIKAKVVVQVRVLKNKLREIGLVKRKVRGLNLAAKMQSRQNEASSGKEMFMEYLKPFWDGSLVETSLGDPDVKMQPNGKALATFPVTIRMNPAATRNAYRRMYDFMAKVAKRVEFSRSPFDSNSREPYVIFVKGRPNSVRKIRYPNEAPNHIAAVFVPPLGTVPLDVFGSGPNMASGSACGNAWYSEGTISEVRWQRGGIGRRSGRAINYRRGGHSRSPVGDLSSGQCNTSRIRWNNCAFIFEFALRDREGGVLHQAKMCGTAFRPAIFATRPDVFRDYREKSSRKVPYIAFLQSITSGNISWDAYMVGGFQSVSLEVAVELSPSDAEQVDAAELKLIKTPWDKVKKRR